jgi:hypothetical protein
MRSSDRRAVASSKKAMSRANRAVEKSRPNGLAGSRPVKKSQSTAPFKANSAADPAKTNRIVSPSPQMDRTIEPGATKGRITMQRVRGD